MQQQGHSPSVLAWRRFRRNKPAMVSLLWLLFCICIAVFAYPLMPDDTSNGNFQVVELPKRPPGTPYTVLLQPNSAVLERPGLFGYLLNGTPDRFRPIPVGVVETVQIKGDTICYNDLFGQPQVLLLPSFLLPIDKYASQSLTWREQFGKPYLLENDQVSYVDSAGNVLQARIDSLSAVFWDHHLHTGHYWLGSDAAGRDLLSRLLLGTRVSLGIGFMAVLVSLALGTLLGALAGFFRGWIDRLIMWLVSVVWSIPTLLLAIALAFVLGKGTWQLFLAIGVSSWVEVARLVRGQIFGLRELQFVEATKALGFHWPRAIFRHMLPNVLSPLIIVAASNFSSAILMEAGLSFLGVGVQPPAPSWGSMIKDGYGQIMFDSGLWLAIFPGLAMILVVISLNLVGYGLRDALDPKHQQ